MQLRNIKAVPHANGNRVDLSWLVPQPGRVDYVRVMRGKSTYPRSYTADPAAGNQWVADIENKILFSTDTVVKDELDKHTLPSALIDQFLCNHIALPAHTRVSVTQSGQQWQLEYGSQIYIIVDGGSSLNVYGVHTLTDIGLRAETVYYYTLFPYQGEPGKPGEFLLHRDNRVSVMATGTYDFAGQIMRLLPAIYHRYDTGQLRAFLELPGGQLDQLYSFACASLNLHDIDRVDGKFLPLLAQWIGWTIDTYELDIGARRGELKKVPALYETVGVIPAVEAAIAKFIGGWESRTKEFCHNVFLSNQPERLNFYMCTRKPSGQWRESQEVFSMDEAYDGRPAAAVDDAGTLYLFYHTHRNKRWDIWYKTREKIHDGTPDETWQWTSSRPFTCSGNIDKYPAAVYRSGDLWVFWSCYNQTLRTWEIRCRKGSRDQWLDMDLPGESGNPRKSPCAVVDGLDRLWLFWLGKTNGTWRLRYNRHDGSAWQDEAVDFPECNGEVPRVENDLFVLHEPGQEKDGGKITLFWSQKQQLEDRRGRWQIAWRRKTGTLSLEDGWGAVGQLDKVPVSQVVGDIDYDDVEPSAFVDDSGETRFFWVSNRSGRNWAICSVNFMDINSRGHLETAEIVTGNPYSRRAPLPFMLDGNLALVYRSNRSVTYQSERYKATTTTDFRYAGSLSMDTRNQARNARRGMYDDFQTYTYDTGAGGEPTNNDWYARDAIGLYLKPPDIEDARSLTDKQEVIKDILARFLPIQSRAVFILEPPIYGEKVFTCVDQFFDAQLTEIYPPVNHDYFDKAQGWTWIRSWSPEHSGHNSVDFYVSPVTTRYRTIHTALKDGEEDE